MSTDEARRYPAGTLETVGLRQPPVFVGEPGQILAYRPHRRVVVCDYCGVMAGEFVPIPATCACCGAPLKI